MMETQLSKQIAEAKEQAKDLKAVIRQRAVDNKNELKIKLNEKVMEMKDDHQKKVEEAVMKEMKNLKNQMEQQAKKHYFEMEKNDIDMAAKEDALSRALARRIDVEQKLRDMDRAMTKANLKKIRDDEAKRS